MPYGLADNSATPAPSDRSLVRRVADGNPSAADELYHRYADRIRSLVRAELSRSLARRLDPDDIVQSVFRRFFVATGRGRYHLPTDADLWNLFVTITLNRLRSAERFHRAAKRDVHRSVDAAALAAVADDETGTLDRAVADALDLLPDTHREVVQLRLDGWEVAELANRIGRSKRTVERMLQEARERLDTILASET